jgi:single-strand DNA-binding protein
MAGSLNKATLIGRLGQDPELRHTQSNMAVCNFSIATTESWKNQGGQDQEKTEWHKIVVWGRQAEIANQYLAKGRLVYVEGRLQTRKYTDQSGVERRSTEIVARDIQFLGSRNDREGIESMPVQTGSMQSAPDSAPADTNRADTNRAAAPPANDFTEDDIPF